MFAGLQGCHQTLVLFPVQENKAKAIKRCTTIAKDCCPVYPA
jgi:hypothetical protein